MSRACCARHVRLEWAEKLGLKSFELGGPFDKALDAVCERLGVSFKIFFTPTQLTFTALTVLALSPFACCVNPERRAEMSLQVSQQCVQVF